MDNKNISISFQDLYSDPTPLKLSNASFMFAIGLISGGEGVPFDDTYFSLSIQYIKNETSNLYEELGYEKCNNLSFSNMNSSFANRLVKYNFICPKSLDVNLVGNGYSLDFRYIDVEFIKCNGTNADGVPCKSNQEIYNYIDNISLNFLISSAYFDFEDYSDPIKEYVDDSFSFNFVSGFTVQLDMKVRENFAEKNDDIFRYNYY